MNPTPVLRRLSSLIALLGAAWLSSCTSMQPPPPPPSPVMSASEAPATAGLHSRSYSAKVDDRPGLGTVAGYEQNSTLQRARLIRKSSVPDAVDSFHYNDEAGAKTMVGILGGSTAKHSGLFSAAGDRLKVGLVHYSEAYPRYEASGRRIVIGNAGSHYAVRLENRSKHRQEVVLSVDGLNVLSGQSASPSQHGFVLEPKQTYDVEGFRKNSSTVKTFLFGRVADSAAAAKGKAGNVGVIGLAVFEEDEARAKAELQREQFQRENAQAFPVSR